MMEKKYELSPADCDRWDTIPGATRNISKPTPVQIAVAKEVNAQRAAEKAAKLAAKNNG